MFSTLRLCVALAVALAVLAAGSAAAQSLADVARKEQERRRGVQSASKVYTNEDLRRGGIVPAPAQPTEAAVEWQVEAPEPAGRPQAAPQDPPQGEEYWRGRITEVRLQLQRSEMFLEALQSRVNALWSDFLARDDPAQRAVIGEERQKALSEMERVEAEVAQYTREIAEITEEARRAGVPPGWLR